MDKIEKIAEMKAKYSIHRKKSNMSYNNPEYLTPFKHKISNVILHLIIGIVLNSNIIDVYYTITYGRKLYGDILYIIFYPFIVLYELLS